MEKFEELNNYEVWQEGYLDSGMNGIPESATLLGTYEAASFKEACKMAAKEHQVEKKFDKKNLTIYGCQLFDNEADARKKFG